MVASDTSQQTRIVTRRFDNGSIRILHFALLCSPPIFLALALLLIVLIPALPLSVNETSGKFLQPRRIYKSMCRTTRCIKTVPRLRYPFPFVSRYHPNSDHGFISSVSLPLPSVLLLYLNQENHMTSPLIKRLSMHNPMDISFSNKLPEIISRRCDDQWDFPSPAQRDRVTY